MLLRAVCLLCAICTGLAAAPPPLTWPMMKDFKGQWKITYALTSGPNKAQFVAHNCSSQLATAACNQPPMTKLGNDRIQVSFSLKNTSVPFRALKNGTAQTVKVVMCYSPKSFADRPWRKLKPIIAKDTSCPYVLGKKPFANLTDINNVTFNFNVTTNLVTASWYVKVVVLCKDGHVCQFDETNTTNSNFFRTHREQPQTTGMIAAAAVCSVIGPVFFSVFFFLDSRRRKNQ